MIDRKQIEALIRSTLIDVLGADEAARRTIDSSDALVIPPDRGVNLGTPFDKGALEALMRAQPARIAVGRAGVGTRYRTNTILRFRADHAAAKDAVWSEVDPKLIERLGMFEVRTRAEDKRHFLQRPDAGRALSDEARVEIQHRCQRSPQLQVIYGDGLSAAALNEHLETYHRALEKELSAAGIRMGTPFFVRYSRVKVMDEIARLLDAEAALFACGERPGLGYSDSLSAYYIYRPAEGATDASREVISNINPRGVEPARAANLTREAILRILRERKSGVMP
ncbi:MAG: ethanolamine ammonia-lyase subunit EutC [Deltaproteobacteria bacterium]|nr:ethanolamine ammonia-lyase subunit EutC [Deltaproteobacteria bacterium]